MKNISKTLLYTLIIVLISSAYHFIQNDNALRTTIKHLYDDISVKHQDGNLMLGSSSIERLKPLEYLGCDNWLNRGVGGSTLSNLNDYLLLSPLKITPKNILLYAGENDIGYGFLSASGTIKEYEQVLQHLLVKYPASNLHVIAIKPSPQRKKYWNDFKQVNTFLEDYLSKIDHAYFYNPDWESIESGESTAVFTSDGIHLTNQGYVVFTSGLKVLCSKK